MKTNDSLVLLTADLGFRLFDDFSEVENFVSLGSSEQFMIGAAAGLATERKIPVCYSITPFLLYRPFEFIRNFMHYEQMPIKLVGSGRGQDYKALGHTHWAEEDREVFKAFDIQIFYPNSEEEVVECFSDFLYNGKPSYINLSR